MINREDAIAFFLNLAEERGLTTEISAVKLLPPLLCRKLLLKDDILSGASEAELFVGHSDLGGFFYRSLYLSPGGFVESVQKQLPLEHHLPVRAPGIYRWITLALDELQDFNPEAFNVILAWCSVIVWLRRDERCLETTELTSTSIPVVPFATFVSRKIIRHIPPKTILPVVSYYGIQENLFHEALHQQMTFFIISGGAFISDLHHDDRILIPWRNCDWAIDRVLHAAWVYKGILWMRRHRVEHLDGLSNTLRTALVESISEADDALHYLASELKIRRHLFTPSGVDLIDKIVEL